jgi:hypothetical protein
VVWLASEEAGNVNGRIFQVQTGKIALYSEPVEEKVINKPGSWTIDDVFNLVPSITKELVNPTERKPKGGSPL